MKKITLTIITLLIIQLINAQQTITTYSTGYNSIEGIAINSNNEVYVSEHDTGKVYSIDDSTGNKTEYASTGGFYANNIIFNTNNDLFIAEPFLTKIFIKNTTADASVYLNINFVPNSFAIDSAGDLYVSSISKIVKINSDLSTTDYATGFLTIEGIAFDSNNNLYAADRNDRKLYKIASNGTKTVVASNIQNIRGVAIDPNDKVYFTNSTGYSALNGKILKYDPTTNAVTDFVTTNLDNPRHIAIDNLGNMYVTNLGNETVVKINDTSLLSNTPPVVYIPDANFKTELINNSLINTNMDDEIQKTEALEFDGFISVPNKGISNLTGIEDFTEIIGLYCPNNLLTTLDVSNNTQLTYLYCSVNSLTALDVSNNTELTSLYCTDNQISNLNTTLNTGLVNLWCQRNEITSLDVSNNTLLVEFICSNNLLPTLDVLTNTSIESLIIGQNYLTTIDLSSNVNLKRLDFLGNNISTIDLSNNTELTFLDCRANGMTSLNLDNNTKLTEIKIGSNNNLSEIDLTTNVLLEEIQFQSTSITTLDLSNNINLIYILGSSHVLESIDLRNGMNTEITNFQILNAWNLSCVFVDDKNYSQTNWVNPNPGTTNFVETEAECSALSVNNSEIVNFYLYPNPVTNKLIITSATVIKQVELYNSIGQILLKEYDTNNIDVSILTNGIYYIRITDNLNNLITKKIIKQ